jgi:hypothetical protein
VSIALVRRLVAVGEISVADGTLDCADGALVRVQRKISDRWTTIQATRANRVGSYRVTIPNFPGKYRAFVPNLMLRSGDRCTKAISEVTIRSGSGHPVRSSPSPAAGPASFRAPGAEDDPPA